MAYSEQVRRWVLGIVSEEGVLAAAKQTGISLATVKRWTVQEHIVPAAGEMEDRLSDFDRAAEVGIRAAAREQGVSRSSLSRRWRRFRLQCQELGWPDPYG